MREAIKMCLKYAEMILENETSESCILSVLYKNILKLGNVSLFWVKEVLGT